MKTKHPNRLPFEGILTYLDRPSDSAPSGARGHKVILTTEAAQDALPSLIGMAVSFRASWDGHDRRQKCGVIEDAFLEGNELRVRGYVFGHDFPEVAAEMTKGELGMSYELIDAHVEDMRAHLWKLTKATFTGAAILLRDRAAYKSTRINLSAEKEIFNGKLSFIDEGVILVAKG